ncbi:unnamed protein product [Closterium sp. NIES-65]|nr:unnamed protein product [Closterium sp. NIES-65]
MEAALGCRVRPRAAVGCVPQAARRCPSARSARVAMHPLQPRRHLLGANSLRRPRVSAGRRLPHPPPSRAPRVALVAESASSESRDDVTVTGDAEEQLRASATEGGAEEAGAFEWSRAWYAVGVASDMDAARPHAVTVVGRPLVLWRDAAGSWRCFLDQCPSPSPQALRVGSHLFPPHPPRPHLLSPPPSFPPLPCQRPQGRIDAEGRLACSYHGRQQVVGGARAVGVVEGSNDTPLCRTSLPSGKPEGEATLQRRICASQKFTQRAVACKLIAPHSPRSPPCTPATPFPPLPLPTSQGVLFVWPDEHSPQQAEAMPLPLPHGVEWDQYDALPHYTRRLAYGYEVLAENVVDLSHFPFAHHGVGMTTRDQGKPVSDIGMKQLPAHHNLCSCLCCLHCPHPACTALTLPALLSPCLHCSHPACTALTLPALPTPCLHCPHPACTALTLPALLSPCLHCSRPACTALTLPALPSPCLHCSHPACTALTLPALLSPCLHCSHPACTALTLPALLSPCLHCSRPACTALTLPALPSPCLHCSHPACTALTLPALLSPCLHCPHPACTALTLPALLSPCLHCPHPACTALTLPALLSPCLHCPHPACTALTLPALLSPALECLCTAHQQGVKGFEGPIHVFGFPTYLHFQAPQLILLLQVKGDGDLPFLPPPSLIFPLPFYFPPPLLPSSLPLLPLSPLQATPPQVCFAAEEAGGHIRAQHVPAAALHHAVCAGQQPGRAGALVRRGDGKKLPSVPRWMLHLRQHQVFDGECCTSASTRCLMVSAAPPPAPGGAMAYPPPLAGVLLPPQPAPKEQVLERMASHTAHCTACSGALTNVQRLQLLLPADSLLSAAAAVASASLRAHLPLAVLALAAAAAAWKVQEVAKEFVYTGWDHATRD